MVASFSQIRAWSTEHPIDAAGYWTKTARSFSSRWLLEVSDRPGAPVPETSE
jgi:hypothetical protein